MRKLGFVLIFLGFIWIAILQFNLFMRAGLRSIVLGQYAKLSNENGQLYTRDEVQEHIRDTALVVNSHAPNVIAPGSIMLLGGLLLALRPRRQDKTAA